MKSVWIVSGVIACLSFSSLRAQEAPPQQPSARPPRPGVSTPGVKREMSTLKPIAIFPVEGTPDWQAVTADAVWVSNGPKNTVHKLDAKTNTVTATVVVGQKPCSGLVAAFDSIWAPNCDDKTLSRIDPKTNKVAATLHVGPAASEGGLTANADSIWILSDPKGVLSRIDPDTNRVVAEIQVPAGSFVCVLGEDNAIWVVSSEQSVIVRVDPKTNLITDRVEVGPRPRFTAAGGGSIWTLNQGDGTVSRVDVKTRKLLTNIELGVPGGGGEIAYGEGHVWVTVFDIPLSQINPDTNKVVKQWVGAGGDAVRVGHGSIWLSNLRQQNVWRLEPKQP
jgi:virginiamycin B lyase